MNKIKNFFGSMDKKTASFVTLLIGIVLGMIIGGCSSHGGHGMHHMSEGRYGGNWKEKNMYGEHMNNLNGPDAMMRNEKGMMVKWMKGEETAPTAETAPISTTTPTQVQVQ